MEEAVAGVATVVANLEASEEDAVAVVGAGGSGGRDGSGGGAGGLGGREGGCVPFSRPPGWEQARERCKFETRPLRTLRTKILRWKLPSPRRTRNCPDRP